MTAFDDLENGQSSKLGKRNWTLCFSFPRNPGRDARTGIWDGSHDGPVDCNDATNDATNAHVEIAEEVAAKVATQSSEIAERGGAELDYHKFLT